VKLPSASFFLSRDRVRISSAPYSRIRLLYDFLDNYLRGTLRFVIFRQRKFSRHGCTIGAPWDALAWEADRD
jgi:hypothetical protein